MAASNPRVFCARREGGKCARHGWGALKDHIPGASYVPDANTNTSDTRYFNVGEKVYPSNIAVDLKKEKISFGVVACDTCNQTNPPTYYKSEVDFQFAKGYLETADVSKVEDTIGEVFAIDTSNPGPKLSNPRPSRGRPAHKPGERPRQSSWDKQSTRWSALLGQPERIANLGSKQIYVYKDLKVTFVNGKVSDVQ